VSVTAAKGFRAAGIACGIKPSGNADLSFVATTDGRPVPAAGVFTTNLATAPPVLVSRDHLRTTGGRATAVILSSGNANAATGAQGRRDAERMCELSALGLAASLGADVGGGVTPEQILVCSTGLIGIPMPMAHLEDGIPRVVAELATGDDAGARAARGIMTTDTVPKTAVSHGNLPDGGPAFTAGGMAKGAGMISPAMATMLALVTTDAAVEPRALQRMLEAAVDSSFNGLTVDGCTSTNDTVLVLASGAVGNTPIDDTTSMAYHAVAEAVRAVCASLAEQIARDAEGVTKLVRVEVRGARSRADAARAARAVANSLLVKCSWYGQDPYWGRVLSELGASGSFIDPDRVSIAYNGIVVCEHGIAAPHDEGAAREAMTHKEIVVTADLRLGNGEATILTTDLGHGYIDENMGTS
jgi:glutamate N-acetyltransferase / amino-acid N-acetyltransferase